MTLADERDIHYYLYDTYIGLRKLWQIIRFWQIEWWQINES